MAKILTLPVRPRRDTSPEPNTFCDAVFRATWSLPLLRERDEILPDLERTNGPQAVHPDLWTVWDPRDRGRIHDRLEIRLDTRRGVDPLWGHERVGPGGFFARAVRRFLSSVTDGAGERPRPPVDPPWTTLWTARTLVREEDLLALEEARDAASALVLIRRLSHRLTGASGNLEALFSYYGIPPALWRAGVGWTPPQGDEDGEEREGTPPVALGREPTADELARARAETVRIYELGPHPMAVPHLRFGPTRVRMIPLGDANPPSAETFRALARLDGFLAAPHPRRGTHVRHAVFPPGIGPAGLGCPNARGEIVRTWERREGASWTEVPWALNPRVTPAVVMAEAIEHPSIALILLGRSAREDEIRLLRRIRRDLFARPPEWFDRQAILEGRTPDPFGEIRKLSVRYTGTERGLEDMYDLHRKDGVTASYTPLSVLARTVGLFRHAYTPAEAAAMPEPLRSFHALDHTGLEALAVRDVPVGSTDPSPRLAELCREAGTDPRTLEPFLEEARRAIPPEPDSDGT